MSFKKNKSHQIIVKSKSLNNNGENDGEFVINNNDIITTVELISSFSQEQIIGFMIIISVVMNARLKQRFGNFNTNRQQSNSFLSIKVLQPH